MTQTPNKTKPFLLPDRDLHPRQLTAWKSPATEMLYGGAAGGGKSHFMRYLALYCAFYCPGIQVYLFRRTYPDLQKNHMEGPTSFPNLLAGFIDKKLVSIDHGKGIIKFGNKSRIFLCHCQHEKHKTNYQGAEIHVLLIDELTHFTDTIYKYLRGRCRLGAWRPPKWAKGRFPKILNGSNPGGVGHNWVKEMFVTYAPPEKVVKTKKIDGSMRRVYIPAKISDNPTLLENDPEYIDRLEGLGDKALVQAMKNGDWDIVSGGALDDVWKREIHMIKPFPIPRRWLVDRSFDWGSSKPFSVGWWAMSNGEEVEVATGVIRCFPKGTLFRIDEWYGWNGTPNKGCKMNAKNIAKGIKEREKVSPFLKNLWVRPGPADNSIFDTTNDVCIADDMKAVGIKWRRADKSPGSRVNGLEKVRQFFEASKEHPMEEPGIYAFEHCLHFSRTLPVLPRDEMKQDDVDTDAEEHLYDEVRYRVTAPKRGTTTQEV
jgi:hypothetical protein